MKYKISKKFTTNLPVETLNKLTDYMQGIYDDLVSGGMPDQEGKCFEIADFIKYLKSLKLSYGVCDICGRFIAPDERYSEVNDQIICSECEQDL